MDEEKTLQDQEAAQEMPQTAAETPKPGVVRMREKIKEWYPERELAEDDEEEMYNALEEYLGGVETELVSYKTNSEALINRLMEKPALIKLMTEVGNLTEADAIKQFIQAYADEIKDLFDEDDRMSALADAVQRKEQLEAERSEFASVIDANQAKSIPLLSAFIDAKKITEDEAMDFFSKFLELGMRISKFDFSSDDLEMVYKGLKYDEATADAQRVGEVKAKNAKIEAAKKKMEGDGMPVVVGGSTTEAAPQRRFANAGRRSIWDD